jgi:hypothetical protein
MKSEEGGGSAVPLLPSLRTDAMPVGSRSRTAPSPRRLLPAPRSLPPWTWVAVGGVLLSIAAAIGIALGPDLSRPPTPPAAAPEPRFGDLHRNVDGGYAFRYPDRWRIDEAGTVTLLRAPKGQAVVTFGIGARGAVHDTQRALLSGIERSYRRVRLEALQVAPIADRPAVTVAGTGVNERGVPIRFLAATIGGAGRNHSITMFTAAGGEAMPALQRILDSFRVTVREAR